MNNKLWITKYLEYHHCDKSETIKKPKKVLSAETRRKIGISVRKANKKWKQHLIEHGII